VIVQNGGAGVRAESGASVTAFNNTIDGNNPGVHADAATAILTNNLISNNTTAGVRASGRGQRHAQRSGSCSFLLPFAGVVLYFPLTLR